MSDLIVAVQTVDGEARADSRGIAQALGNQHKNVLALIDDYEDDFAELGRVAFQTPTVQTSGGPQKTRCAMLNENQCYFLLTLVRNSEVVVRLKLELVKAFARARELAAQVVPALPTDPVELLALSLQGLQQHRQQLAAIEQRLETQDQQLSQVRGALDDRPITGSQPNAIKSRVARLAKLMGGKPAHYAEAWRRFKIRFDIASYRDLPARLFDDGVRFLDMQIASYGDGDLFTGGNA